MKQLELRFYTRPEIAEVLSVNIEDSNHFAGRVKKKLENLGYGFRYINKQGVEILTKPETPAARLAEIVYRVFKIDIQIQPVHFAHFITAFTDIEGFESMPWEQRTEVYYQTYHISVASKTLSNWCKKLLQCGVMVVGGSFSRWRTDIIDGGHIRTPVETEEDIQEMKRYYDRRKAIFEEINSDLLKQGTPPKEARDNAWKLTYNNLWAEFGCCYYYCKQFQLSAFTETESFETLQEVYELSRELAPAGPLPKEAELILFQQPNPNFDNAKIV